MPYTSGSKNNKTHCKARPPGPALKELLLAADAVLGSAGYFNGDLANQHRPTGGVLVGIGFHADDEPIHGLDYYPKDIAVISLGSPKKLTVGELSSASAGRGGPRTKRREEGALLVTARGKRIDEEANLQQARLHLQH